MGLFNRRKSIRHEPRWVAFRPIAAAPGIVPLAALGLPPGSLVEAADGSTVAWMSQPGDHFDLWVQLVERFAETGWWPVSTGNLASIERPWSSRELLGAVEPIAEIEVVLGRAVAEADGHFGPATELLDAQGRYVPLGAGVPARTQPAIRTPRSVEHLLLVPVTRPADVPWVLGWDGACNYDLAGGDISGVLRSWEDRYGAFITEIGFDVLQLSVQRPPTEPNDIAKVAREHWVFCWDIVEQGVGKVAELEPGIAAGDWGFWWD